VEMSGTCRGKRERKALERSQQGAKRCGLPHGQAVRQTSATFRCVNYGSGVLNFAARGCAFKTSITLSNTSYATTNASSRGESSLSPPRRSMMFFTNSRRARIGKSSIAFMTVSPSAFISFSCSSFIVKHKSTIKNADAIYTNYHFFGMKYTASILSSMLFIKAYDTIILLSLISMSYLARKVGLRWSSWVRLLHSSRGWRALFADQLRPCPQLTKKCLRRS
jgi:hypothetical protein